MHPDDIVAILGDGRQKAYLAGFGSPENLRLRPWRNEPGRERREARPDRV